MLALRNRNQPYIYMHTTFPTLVLYWHPSAAFASSHLLFRITSRHLFTPPPAATNLKKKKISSMNRQLDFTFIPLFRQAPETEDYLHSTIQVLVLLQISEAKFVIIY